jgi:hypothetical protein
MLFTLHMYQILKRAHKQKATKRVVRAFSSTSRVEDEKRMFITAYGCRKFINMYQAARTRAIST